LAKGKWVSVGGMEVNCWVLVLEMLKFGEVGLGRWIESIVHNT
jgi:hypothetical protein